MNVIAGEAREAALNSSLRKPSGQGIGRRSVTHPGRAQRALHVGLRLRLPDPPEPGELPDRVVVPVDPQVGDRPRHRFGDDHPSRTDRGDLAPRVQPARKAAMSRSPRLSPCRSPKAASIAAGTPRSASRLPAAAAPGGADVGRLAQRQLARVAGRTARRVHHRQLPVRDVLGAAGQGRRARRWRPRRRPSPRAAPRAAAGRSCSGCTPRPPRPGPPRTAPPPPCSPRR